MGRIVPVPFQYPTIKKAKIMEEKTFRFKFWNSSKPGYKEQTVTCTVAGLKEAIRDLRGENPEADNWEVYNDGKLVACLYPHMLKTA